MRVQDAYTDWSATYDFDRNLTRDLDQFVTKEVLGGRRFQTVLEAGCGTGKNTSFFAGLSDYVWALDLSVGMLTQAKAKLYSHRVLLTVADITKPWPCKAGSVQLVTCNLVLEHIQELRPVFVEAHRALAPGGQFLVSELHPFRQYQGTQANFQRHDKRIEIAAFIHHLSDFTNAAAQSGLSLQRFQEWWHETDQNKPPRIVSFLFEKLRKD